MLAPLNAEIDSFFFDSAGKKIRLSTDETPLKKPIQQQEKLEKQSKLKTLMAGYLIESPCASLCELAYANHCGYTTPPRCRTCGELSKFGRDDWAKYCNAQCFMLNPEVKEEKRERCLEKYGVIHQFCTPACIEKKQKAREKIQAKNEAKNEAKKLSTPKKGPSARQIKLSARANRLKALTEERTITLSSLGFSNIVFGKGASILEMTHTCGLKIVRPRLPTQCFQCEAPKKESSQWRFSNLIRKDFTRNHRIAGGKYQLDAYWAHTKIAVEYNGLYWHSTAPKPGNSKIKDRFYHQDKMLAAKEEGIRLITVWEDEARDMDFAKHVEHLFYAEKINARSCELRHISSVEATAFLDEFHRDGGVRGASVKIGLYHKGILVMVATFGRNRFKGIGNELYRMATRIGFTVRGGVSKIIKHFLSTHKEKLTTYSSAAWGWGEAYLKAGGKCTGLTKPGYFYFNQKTGTRLHRLALSKSSFEKTTGVPWDPALTEEQNAAKVKCWIVWDCGNWKFEWDNTLGK